jgi:hypothetical protein
MVGASGGGRLNVVVGVHVAIDGGATSVVGGAAWGAAVVEVVADVVSAVGATARVGPFMLLNSQ